MKLKTFRIWESLEKRKKVKQFRTKVDNACFLSKVIKKNFMEKSWKSRKMCIIAFYQTEETSSHCLRQRARVKSTSSTFFFFFLSTRKKALQTEKSFRKLFSVWFNTDMMLLRFSRLNEIISEEKKSPQSKIFYQRTWLCLKFLVSSQKNARKNVIDS